jgi:cysteine desulfurase
VVIYLDHNATTPVAPSVLEAMTPFLSTEYANPSSTHEPGRRARSALDEARRRVAGFLGAEPGEIIFAGSGSEANNLAIRGAALASFIRTGRNTVVTQSTEHPSVLEAARALGRLHGLRIKVVGVDRYGTVDLDALRFLVDERTAIVSVQLANGETGTLQPVAEVVDVARRHGAVVHTDASQAAGRLPVSVESLGVDLLTIAGHKMYGPKGVGALYRRAGVELEPIVYGGGQEDGLRAGTQAVALIVGLAAACEVSRQAASDGGRVRLLRDNLFDAISSGLWNHVYLNGHPKDRLPNTLNISVEGVEGHVVLAAAEGLAASTGSACHSTRHEPSPVLMAMGCSPTRALEAIRLSLGHTTQADEVRRAVYLLARAVAAAFGNSQARNWAIS